MSRRWDMPPDVERRFRKAVAEGATLAVLTERFSRPSRTIRHALKRLGLEAAPDKREPATGTP